MINVLENGKKKLSLKTPLKRVEGQTSLGSSVAKGTPLPKPRADRRLDSARILESHMGIREANLAKDRNIASCRPNPSPKSHSTLRGTAERDRASRFFLKCVFQQY